LLRKVATMRHDDVSRSGARSGTWWVGPAVHGGFVVLLSVLTVVGLLREPGAGEGVDLFLGFILLALLALGLPWSLSYLVVVGVSPVSTTTFVALAILTVVGSALVNVVLHWVWAKRGYRTWATGYLDRRGLRH
jgi:hypothetical protein